MDILSHTLSGVAIGTVAASFSKNGLVEKGSTILICGFAGALPDVDAISLWSHFDTTIGNLLQLEHSGKVIYSSKFWYSHHGFMHSLFAGFLFTFLISLLIKMLMKELNWKSFLAKKKSLLLGTLGAFVLHLIEDMPTPSSSWGGVNFFWPSNNYIGGFGKIWWWNNYDIFLIIVSVVFINFIIVGLSTMLRKNAKYLVLVVFIIGVMVSLRQIHTRSVDFNYIDVSGKYHELEEESLEIQKQILGKRTFAIMHDFDKKLKIYF